MSQEIADSDAEDDAMDIDEEASEKRTLVPPASHYPTEQPDWAAERSVAYQENENVPLSVVDPEAAPSGTQEASAELEVATDHIVDGKSLERSKMNIKNLSDVPGTEPLAAQVGATETPSLIKNESRTNTPENLTSLAQMNKTNPQTSPLQTDRPKDLSGKIEEPRSDGRSKSQMMEAEPHHTAIASKPCGKPIGSNQADHILAEVLGGSNASKDVVSGITTVQSEETLRSGEASITDLIKDEARRSQKSDFQSVEGTGLNPSMNATQLVQEALSKTRNDAHKASQNQIEAEPISASSIIAESSIAPSSDTSEQPSIPEISRPETPQAEQTPEQKRMAYLQTRNTALSQTLTSLSQQRLALLHSLSSHLSPYTLADIPSVLKPYRGKPVYNPSTAAHTTPLPAPITPEDDAKLIAEARQTIKDHIGRLHRYNEIRDVGQGLIGMIADQRGKRIVDCMDEFGVGVGD